MPIERCCLILLVVVASACSNREPAGTPDEPVAEASGTASDDAVIAEKIRALRDRHACNRVTGCPGLVDLFQYRSALIDPAAQALARPDRGDGHWTIVLPELLGQLQDPRAAEPLMKLLPDRRWETRIAAAIGLGHLGRHAPPEVRVELLRLASLPDNEPKAGGDLGFRAALEYALINVDPDHAQRHREKLLSLLPMTREEVRNVPPPILDVLIQLIGHARLSEALPCVRHALDTGNRFVVATALRVAGALRDSGAIRRIIALTEDRNPTIRKDALSVLTDITGARFDTPDQWRAWAERVGAPRD